MATDCPLLAGIITVDLSYSLRNPQSLVTCEPHRDPLKHPYVHGGYLKPSTAYDCKVEILSLLPDHGGCGCDSFQQMSNETLYHSTFPEGNVQHFFVWPR